MTLDAPPPVDPTPATPGIPAGWYFDVSSGRQRWWDGRAWTEHFALAAPPVRASTGSGAAPLVLGLIGFFLTPIPFFIGLLVGGIPALLAVIYGIVGIASSSRHGSPSGAAIAGVVLGGIALIGIPFGSGTIW